MLSDMSEKELRELSEMIRLEIKARVLARLPPPLPHHIETVKTDLVAAIKSYREYCTLNKHECGISDAHYVMKKVKEEM